VPKPRAYSPSPVGLNFVLLSASHTTGDILFDPSGPVNNVDARMNAAVAGYGHTFGLFDHLASVTLAVPYAWGQISGDVGEDRHEIHRSGLGDAQFRFALNLIGLPALTAKEFAVRTPQTTVGLSLTVTPPRKPVIRSDPGHSSADTLRWFAPAGRRSTADWPRWFRW